MKKSAVCSLSILVLGMMGIVAEAKAEVKVTCDASPYVVVLEDVSATESKFSLLQNEQNVGDGVLQVIQGGFEPFLEAYVWTLSTADHSSVVGVAIPGLKTPVPGIYSGKSDMLVVANGHIADGSSLNCEIVIR